MTLRRIPAVVFAIGLGWTLGSCGMASDGARDAAGPAEDAACERDGVCGAAARMPVFVLPAPAPSARMIYPSDLLAPAGAPLAHVAGTLTRRLEAAGYQGASLFRVRGGFAMVTPVEGVDAHGKPLPGPERWVLDARPLLRLSRYITLMDIASALTNADAGTYRMLAFVVTTEPVTVSDRSMESDTARTLFLRGVNALPTSYGRLPYTSDYDVTVLIYEFRRSAVGGPAKLSSPSRIPAAEQLRLAGLI